MPSTITGILMASSGAMIKLFIIYVVGVIAAKYPKADPILVPKALRFISRLITVVLLPCLIIKSLGSTINSALMAKIGIMVPFCLFVYTISYLSAYFVGFYIHGAHNGDRSSELFTSIKMAACNPNAVALPILVMQTLCEDKLIKSDYNDDSTQCYNEATSMIFVYIVGWFILFWGVAFPSLQIAADKAKLEGNVPSDDRDQLKVSNASNTSGNPVYQAIEFIQLAFTEKEVQAYIYDKVKRIFVNPAIIGVIIGLFIGLISPIQQALFTPGGSLAILGQAINTLGTPVVALNCLVMSASLAQCDFPIHSFINYFDTFLFKDAHDQSQGNYAAVKTSSATFKPLTTLPQSTSSLSHHIQPTHTHLNVNLNSALAISTVSSIKDIENASEKNLRSVDGESVCSEGSKVSIYSVYEEEEDIISESLVVDNYIPLDTRESIKRENKRRLKAKREEPSVKELHEVSKHSIYSIIEEEENIIGEHLAVDSNLSLEAIESIKLEKQRKLEHKEAEAAAAALTALADSATAEAKREVVVLPPLRSVAAIFVSRLILPPLVMIILNQVFISIGLISKSQRMMALIIILESAAPPAQIIIVALNQLQLTRIAGMMSYMFVYMYAASILTVTIWLTIAMSIYYY